MDEKTAELRDIFVETTGSDTVTESQAEGRGSLADTADEAAVDERLAELVATMRDRYDFRTDLDDEALVALVRGVYAGEDDDALAADLGVDPETVRTARLDLHLVRSADREPQEASVSFDRLRRLVAEGASLDDCVAEVDADRATVARLRAVALADRQSTRANDRFRDEFEELLTDAALQTSHAEGAHEDGLREATEDMETDVAF
jgi:hypothetical protein